ncbi:hypothetical protein D6850_11560 [Roseovarius spongiae]|uniref:Uncharacterized protein n=1 Tax=Roseovarius spongiae TaxID=2320272 RepID=A0A3A8AT54_9RHOB|nr:hypothetical protein [Roseovarius spongiae]RKF13831.1 hypothetical protein D6850_11560 [Roseovarius spongiae]
MKQLMRAAAAALLIARAAQACEDADPAMGDAVRDVLTGAQDARISDWAHYLNDRFHTDVACRLSPGMSAADVRALNDAPEVLIDLAIGAVQTRNQSDALMLMLSAMKQGADEQG